MDFLILIQGLQDKSMRKDPHIAVKPWYYATLMSMYSFFCIVRGTFTTAWVIQLPQDHSLPPIPIFYYDLVVRICLFIAICFCLICLTLTVIRQWEIKIGRISALSSLICGLQSLCIWIAIIYFACTHPTHTSNIDLYYSQGFIASCTSAILSGMSCIFYLIDCTWLLKIQKAYSGHQRKLLFSFFLSMWYILMGSLLFSYLEGWEFEKASQFVVVTLLTIGYGDSSPSTDATKIVLMVYGVVGLFIAGFFVIAIGDALVEKAERTMQLSYAMKQKQKSTSQNPLDLVSFNLDPLPTFSRPYFALPITPIPDKPRVKKEKQMQKEKKKPRIHSIHEMSIIRDQRFRRIGGQKNILIKKRSLLIHGSSPLRELHPSISEPYLPTLSRTKPTLSRTNHIIPLEYEESYTTEGIDTSIDMESSLMGEEPVTAHHYFPIEKRESDHQREIWLFLKVVLWILLWWILSSVVFTLLEDEWTFLDGFYFTFTTMTTIGYGDVALRSPLSWEFWYFFIFNTVSIVAFCFEGLGHDMGYRYNTIGMKWYVERLNRKKFIKS